MNWAYEILALEIKLDHRRECAKLARLLTLVTDERIKRMVWNKFKSL